MIISLVGMSNCGKTYWSKRLETAGFRRFSCDDIIAKKLKKKLNGCGYRGTEYLSKWMGQPYEDRYPQTSKKYLEYERDSLAEIIQMISTGNTGNVVVDTTGSAVYLPEKLLKELQTYTTIIHLDTPKEVLDDMCRLYFKNPKPVIWGNIFQKQNGESNMATLKKCYPSLLEYRVKKYQQIAHIKFDYFLLRKTDFTVNDFIMQIKKA